MHYTAHHKIALPALMENGCFYNPAILSLLYYAAENKMNTENRSNYDSVYGFDYGNGYTSTTTENLTSNFCFENACSDYLNMKGRLYDPVIARFFSPDPYVQFPDFTQGFNRYSYCLNNPLMYTDPTGEKVHWAWWVALADVLTGGAISGAAITTAVATATSTAAAADMLTGGTLSTTFFATFPFTSKGYEIQKYISPIAVQSNFSFGNGRTSLDFNISIGLPRFTATSARIHAGGSYVFRDYDNMYSGWEGRYGFELGAYTLTYTGVEMTWYNRRGTEFDQVRDKMIAGSPLSPLMVQNDNDFSLFRSGGTDMYYTQGIRITMGGIFDIGLDMVTGRPDRNRILYGDGYGNYGTYDPEYETNPHRAGILSFRLGPFRFGWNSEGIRNTFQNGWHDLSFIHTPRFPVMDRRGRFYWTFGGW